MLRIQAIFVMRCKQDCLVVGFNNDETYSICSPSETIQVLCTFASSPVDRCTMQVSWQYDLVKP